MNYEAVVNVFLGDAHPAWMRAEHHILDRLSRREDDPPNLPVGWKPSRLELPTCRVNNHQPHCNRTKIGVTGELVTGANYLGMRAMVDNRLTHRLS